MQTGLVKTDDVLFMRFLLLGALALEVSELLELPKPAFGLEQPDDFKTLDIKSVICPPCNAKAQVIEPSWRRTHWESRTVNAKIHCPSADTAKGLVARTENGSLLVPGKA